MVVMAKDDQVCPDGNEYPCGAVINNCTADSHSKGRKRPTNGLIPKLQIKAYA